MFRFSKFEIDIRNEIEFPSQSIIFQTLLFVKIQAIPLKA